MIKNITLFILWLSFISCRQTVVDEYIYPSNSTISKTDGTPKDSLTFYYPTTISRDTQTIKTELDTFMLNWFSSSLYSAKEPILYNYYLGHDIYRFLWLRSFHRPVVFSLHKDKNSVWLVCKQLNKQPDFIEVGPSVYILPDGTIDTTKRKDNVSKKPDRKASIILNETKQLSENEWAEFEVILNDCTFWTEKSYIDNMGNDGSEWTIEGHLKNKYWFVNRWTPEGKFRKLGEYLITKSGLKEEVY